MIPEYNTDTLPCLVYPLTNTHKESLRGFGGKGITQGQSVSAEVVGKNDDEMLALYNFWKYECMFGLNPFLVSLPMFGDIRSQLVRFKGDFSSTKEGIWKQTLNLEVLGDIVYIIDNEGNFIIDNETSDFIIDNNGDYIATDISNYRSVSYG